MRTLIIRLGRWHARFGMAFAMLAVIALLQSQAGLVWHALEHLALAGNAGSAGSFSVSLPGAMPDSGKAPTDGVCIKCVEGVSNATAIVDGASVAIDAPVPVRTHAAPPSVRAALPAPAARQRGPPSSLV